MCNRTTEYLNSCGRICEKTCDTAFEYDSECQDGFVSDTMRCDRPACHCKKNLVRQNGVCVRKSECPLDAFKCPKKERLDHCGNLCELRCEDVMEGLDRRPCPHICEQPACVCNEGYARRGQVCVLADRCRFKRPRNMTEEEEDEEMDDFLDDDENEPGVRIDGPGTRRRTSDRRVKRCGPNEYLSRCGNKCEPSCDRLNPVCSSRCQPPACHCKQGLVRGPRDACIPHTFCPEVFRCGRHEELNPCGNHCELKCRHVIDGSQPSCRKVCGSPACQCKEGYARHFDNVACIREEDCFRRTTSRDRDRNY
uniref:TIL domain-containing protein n=1 Tax=Romanomermis culicivorax TaxID=13658 RepID=A0A915JTZ5_ROMCU